MRLASITVLLALAWPAAAPAATTLRLDGIGPLHRGMTRADALATGWLTDRRRGCELGGPPVPIVYRLAGPKAPSGLRGTAEFSRGHLRTIAVSRGARTVTGVTAGRSTIGEMVARYRSAGYDAGARYDSTFQGTFVTVKQHGREVLSGFARKNVVGVLAIPFVPVCE